jgi:mycothiol synthase
MSTATVFGPVDPADFDADSFAAVVAAATEADGAEPLNEAALLALRHHGLAGSTLFTAGADGFAWLHGSPAEPEVDLVVAPAARGRGVGAALAGAVVAERPEGALSAWSHGNHPAAAALADRLGFARVRDLWVMRRPLDDLPPVAGAAVAGGAGGAGGTGEVVIRPFEPGADEEAFLALNAEAFAGHPEQGRMTRADLDQRMAEPWFDPAGFFVAQARGDGAAAAGDLLGFHWTKVHPGEPPHGEVYVVGVSPKAQGLGLGRLLTLTGLHHLAGLGLREVVLYVEADNAPAIAVYSRLGFTHADADTHVMYRRRPR